MLFSAKFYVKKDLLILKIDFLKRKKLLYQFKLSLNLVLN